MTTQFKLEHKDPTVARIYQRMIEEISAGGGMTLNDKTMFIALAALQAHVIHLEERINKLDNKPEGELHD